VNKIDLGLCVIGKNLNTWSLRGFANAKVLAAISSPDFYDKFANEDGIQRQADMKHAARALEYATESMTIDPSARPYAFPEVILNVREVDVLEVTDAFDSSVILSFNSLEGIEGADRAVRITINEDLIQKLAEDGKISISRVDGNHRLSATQMAAKDDSIRAFPVVPFSLLVGLNEKLEKFLFRDMNGTAKKMSAAQIDAFVAELFPDYVLLADPKLRLSWFTHKLSGPGMALEGIVNPGGDVKGAKEKFGKAGPLKANSVSTALGVTFKEMDNLFAQVFPKSAPGTKQDELSTELASEMLANAEKLLGLLNQFWLAVKAAYPEAWNDRKNYFIFHNIGVTGLSILAGKLIEDLVEAKNLSQATFNQLLSVISKEVTFANEEKPEGIAGAGGGRIIGDVLLNAYRKQNNAAAWWLGQKPVHPNPILG
jgi:hypothetical protein